MKIKIKTAQPKDVNVLHLEQKGSVFEVRTKKSVVPEKIALIKKKPSSLHWDKRKDALMTSQKLDRPPCHLKLKGIE